MSNYVQPIKDALERLECDQELTALYTLLALIKGKDVTMKDVHDAWAVWKNNIDPTHKSLIPYDELSREVKNLDAEYTNAIYEAAPEPHKENTK